MRCYWLRIPIRQKNEETARTNREAKNSTKPLCGNKIFHPIISLHARTKIKTPGLTYYHPVACKSTNECAEEEIKRSSGYLPQRNQILRSRRSQTRVRPTASCGLIRHWNEVAVRASDERSVLAVLDPVHERAAHIAEVLLKTLDISVTD
jgi:hypothetical protein